MPDADDDADADADGVADGRCADVLLPLNKNTKYDI
jgi:hypothetical protein